MSPVKYLARGDAPRLAYRLDVPSGEVACKVLLVHGFAEHHARYDHVVGAWNARGIAVGRLDLRGHGLSGGDRGHIDAFTDYLTDVRDVLDALGGEPGWSGAARPVVFGHSMGGLVGTHTALLFPERICGLALSSPFFGIARKLSGAERVLAKVGSRLLPRFRQPSGLVGSELTHDTELAARYDADPLHFDFVTTGWLVAVQDAQKEALARAPELRTPVYGIISGDDRAALSSAAEQFFRNAGSAEKELVVRPDLFHEILNEKVWPELADSFAERMLRWSRA